MRAAPGFAGAVLLLLLAACAAPRPPEVAATSAHPDRILVEDFGFSPGIITLDRSLGFSLYRGEPGVPPRQRADSVGRAAAFNLADTVTGDLARLGYDVEHTETSNPAPGGRALIVRGAFRHIYEGHRHQRASVSVAVEIDYEAPGGGLQRLSVFDLDSRTLPRGPYPGRHGTDVNYQATRLGTAIARYVAEVARASQWPGAAAQ